MAQASVRSYSALKDTQREFETTMILRPDTNKDGIAALVKRLQTIYSKNGGRMQKIDNWGLRTLAYPIETNNKGIYLYVRFLGGSDTVKELERNLGIWDEIVRYLTVLVDRDVDPEARPSDVDDETLDAASDVTPDPLDIAAEKEAALKAELDEAKNRDRDRDRDDDDDRDRDRDRDDDDDDDRDDDDDDDDDGSDEEEE